MADTFKVTAQRNTTANNANGMPTQVVQVSFLTVPGGIPGLVNIPVATYSVDTARAALEAQAETLESVQNL